jgi:hypothetical protein
MKEVTVSIVIGVDSIFSFSGRIDPEELCMSDIRQAIEDEKDPVERIVCLLNAGSKSECFSD